MKKQPRGPEFSLFFFSHPSGTPPCPFQGWRRGGEKKKCIPQEMVAARVDLCWFAGSVSQEEEGVSGRLLIRLRAALLEPDL